MNEKLKNDYHFRIKNYDLYKIIQAKKAEGFTLSAIINNALEEYYLKENKINSDDELYEKLNLILKNQELNNEKINEIHSILNAKLLNNSTNNEVSKLIKKIEKGEKNNGRK